jgi:hypothetical protein
MAEWSTASPRTYNLSPLRDSARPKNKISTNNEQELSSGQTGAKCAEVGLRFLSLITVKNTVKEEIRVLGASFKKINGDPNSRSPQIDCE